MNRQALDDDTWFDIDKAELFEEETFWDGKNRCSKATGSQWTHEQLYRTAGGAWILRHYGSYQESWKQITDEEAARWLVRNEHEAHEACAEQYAALEVQ